MTDSTLRHEIAYTAARFIADDGLDYQAAKRKATKLLLGSKKLPKGDILPDNNEIEEALREYLSLFHAETQPKRLLQLRKVALEVMEQFASYHPYICGAVWNGTATDFSEIVIQCFTDDAKDFQIELLNRGMNFDVSERAHFREAKMVEAVHFEWKNEAVVCVLYQSIDIRGALKVGAHAEAERGSFDALSKKIVQQELMCND